MVVYSFLFLFTAGVRKAAVSESLGEEEEEEKDEVVVELRKVEVELD